MNYNNVISLPVSADLSGQEHRAVYLSATGLALAGPNNRAIGMLVRGNNKRDDGGSAVGMAGDVFLFAGNGIHFVKIANDTAIAMGDELEIQGASGAFAKKVDRSVTGANTGDLWTASAAHNFVANQPVVFTSLDSGGTGFTVGVTYYVRSTGLTSTVFGLSAAPGGALLLIGTGDYSTSSITTVAAGVATEASPATSSGGVTNAILFATPAPVGAGTASAAGATGAGATVLANTPTLITPVIGAATGTSLVLSGGISATGGTLTSPLVIEANEVVTATNVILAGESGTTYFLNSATEFVSTLPAPAAGLRFTFIVTAAPSGASYTVVTSGSANIIKGNQNSVAGDAGDFGTADDTISFVDGQSVAGDKVEVISDGTSWFAYAISKVAAGITFTQAS